MQTCKPFLTLVAGGALAAAGLTPSAEAAVILADDFTGVTRSGNTATISSWDTVSGIDAPSTSLDFFVGGTTTAVSFFNVADEIAVNRNMTADGWDTSITFELDSATQSIDLTTLVLDIRLTNNSGANNTTASKNGRMIAVLEGSSSGVLGTIDPGNLSYPSVEHTRTLDLSGLASLDGSETYTLKIQARGTGFGHFKSLQALELNGDITPVPEPGSLALLGLGGLLVASRRRRD